MLAVRAGYAPDALAATTSGTYAVDGTAYVVNTIDSTVTPLNTRTGKAAKPLSVGTFTYPTVITLSGATAIVIEPTAIQ